MMKSLGFLFLTSFLATSAGAQAQDECATRHNECTANYVRAVAESFRSRPTNTCEAELRICLGGLPQENAIAAPPDRLFLAPASAPAIDPTDDESLVAALILAAGPIEPASLLTPKELHQDQREERINLRQEQRGDRQDLRRDRQEARQNFREDRRDARQKFRQERRQDRRDLRDILR